ncbi:NAD(+) synthase [Thauera sp. Sel9]|uniref:NAD(+) synthase n=1 Tax=Thauera sp. Sel9 TaxID=2974299 RepID=UPI0021E1834F|nr:NAD(+) synthase [Thauera sp. Sel9]MCV2218024.1 NAD(+) synthase [Thauera sp. Sel9]
MQTTAVIDHIVRWLRDYAVKAGVNGFVVGVSGGIDSAVVSTLAARTGLQTLVLEMPIRQKPDQVNRAQEHIGQLRERFSNVEEQWVDLSATFDAFIRAVGIDDESQPHTHLALANARSRLRMIALYYHAQQRGLLVTGTGNKVEDFGVGFFTKYGDGGVDISPIADLLKTQVYELARALDVPQSIQDAAPTDGLWDTDRADEEQMGASYPELEWAMSVYDSHRAEDFDGREREVFEIYHRLHRAMQHKINPIPVCAIPPELLR